MIGRTSVCLVFTCLLAAGTAPLQAAPREAAITRVPGIKVGHFTLPERPTGCTVVLVEGDGAVGGVAQRGGAPGTRETNLLDPLNLVDRVNAIVLAGGSAFGLDAASGTVRWLEERRIGWDTGVARVPIVPAAILFDLTIGDPSIRPTADCGYRAAAATSDGAVAEGNVGAGAGATVGKIGVLARRQRDEDRNSVARRVASSSPMKSGIGTAAIALPNGLVVGAIVAVNAVGDIIDPRTGAIIAGARHVDGTFADARALIRGGALLDGLPAGQNTTIGVVATNARLTKADVNRVALMADDGVARAINPAHTLADGDTVFALATGTWPGTADTSIIGALAAEVLADAIVRAATEATSLPGLPAAR